MYKRSDTNHMRFSKAVETLDREQQQYLVGVAEGMAIVRDDQQNKQLLEV